MKRWLILATVFTLCLSLVGCNPKLVFELPFDSADISNVEMYRQTVPVSAEKKTITGRDDMEALYQLFDGLAVSDRKTEPVAGGGITSFRFHLSDGTSYEIIYCSEAVKSGRLKIPSAGADYFTSADLGACWDHYDYETEAANESELPGME